MDMVNHWNKIYTSSPVQTLGWYEARPEPSLKLLEKCGLRIEDPILDVGCGVSTLIDYLVEKGFQDIYAVDISADALEKSRARLGAEKAALVKWIVDDITSPVNLAQLSNIALWHDRALLHFLIEEEQRQAYKSTLLKAVRPGGYVIVAAFSPKGATMCSGLNVHNYDQNSLAEFLGQDFELKEWFDYLYIQPSGNPRPYTYTLFQRRPAV